MEKGRGPESGRPALRACAVHGGFVQGALEGTVGHNAMGGAKGSALLWHLRKGSSVSQATLDLFVPEVDPAIQSLHDSTACYTKGAVVDEVLRQAGWPGEGLRLLDPGAGDGGFMVHALAMLDADIDDVDGVASRIEGWEIHPVAARMARERIAAHLQGRGWSVESATQVGSRIVIEADFLAPGPMDRGYDIVAGNPPYLRFAHLPNVFRERYEGTVPDFARRDLLHAFLHRCSEVLSEDGRLACVTADRWLINETAGDVRARIGQRFGVESVRRITATDAFHRAKTRRKGTPPRVHPVIVTLAPRDTAARPLTSAPVYPGTPVDLPEDARPLESVARVRVAPWLVEGVFVVGPEQADALPPDALIPAIDNNDIVGGVLQAPQRFAIRTERGVRPDPAVLEHLAANWHLLPRRAHKEIGTEDWWVPKERILGPFDREVLLVPVCGERIRPVRLPAGVVAFNHQLNIVIPAPGDIDAVEGALRSDLAHDLIVQRSKRIDSGWYQTTTRFLASLPMITGWDDRRAA